MIREAIAKVVTGVDLDEGEMVAVMDEIMTGAATEAQIGAFITGLRMKGETIDEIVGAVKVMREKATFVDTGVDTAGGEILMDIVGTGGDGSGTFNVSTTTAFVVAGAGIPVAKHGNHWCGPFHVCRYRGQGRARGGDRLSLCAHAARGHEACHWPAPGNRYPHGL